MPKASYPNQPCPVTYQRSPIIYKGVTVLLATLHCVICLTLLQLLCVLNVYMHNRLSFIHSSELEITILLQYSEHQVYIFIIV